ncbi:MAG: response regulator, partial [Parachlamydiaceae bacterium]|nr:response regulator [Parachlamydiaceae bacterium]
MKKKILLINDDESVKEIFSIYLEMKNYEVFQASTGTEGLEKTKKILPDLILLDVMLSDMNGYEVCERLKKEESTNSIPIIFVSSSLETNDKI